MESKKLISHLEEMLDTHMITCKSSNIVAYCYKPLEKKLFILFKGNQVYAYHNITEREFNDLNQADSKGKWVNTNLIKTRKEYSKYEAY